MTKYETLVYTTDGPIATITLNRPDDLNTIVPPMTDEIEAAVTQGEVEFGLELSQHGEADIAEGSDEVGEHRDVNRHRFFSSDRLRNAFGRRNWVAMRLETF